MLSFEQLTQEALSLPSSDRAILAEKLVESLECDIEPTILTAWSNEAKRRRDQILSGALSPIAGEDGLAQARRLLNQ